MSASWSIRRRTLLAAASAAALLPAVHAQSARELRNAGITVELGDESFRLKKSFETAGKLGIAKVLIVGENEVKAKAFALKNLETGEQITIRKEDLSKKFQDVE